MYLPYQMYRATEQAALPNPGDVPLLYLRCTELYFFVGLTVRIGTPSTASTAFFKLLLYKIPKASDKGATIHRYSVCCARAEDCRTPERSQGQAPCACGVSYPVKRIIHFLFTIFRICAIIIDVND